MALAEELAIPEVIIPSTPGAFSALDLIATDLKRDYVWTLYANLEPINPGRINETFNAMEAAGTATLEAVSIPVARRAPPRFADVRYRLQAYEVTLLVEIGTVTRATLDRLAASFHAKH